MGTVGTNNQSLATAYGSQRKVDRCQNGVLWCAQNPVTASSGAFYTLYSTDGGSTWTSAGTVNNASGSASGSYTPDCSLFIDLDDYAHVVYKDSGNGYLYYTRGTPNTARTAYTWSAPASVETTDTGFDYPDVVAFRDPATSGAWVAWVAYGYNANANNVNSKCRIKRINITSSGAVTVSAVIGGNAALATANATGSFPSLDFRHNGDGKTAATVSGAAQPDLFITWSNGAAGTGYGIRFIKGTYSGGAWTLGTEREIDNTHYIASGPQGWLTCLFDGTRAVLTGYLYTGSQFDFVVYDRDAADTATVTSGRIYLTNSGSSTTALWVGSASYDSNGNVYIFGEEQSSAAGSRNIAYQLWARTTAALGNRTTISATGNGSPNMSSRRGNAGQAIDYVYTSGTASPYTVISGRISLNQPPTAPTLGAPADNATFDPTQSLTLTFTHNDPDGDAASAYDVLYRPAGTSVPYTIINGTTTVANGGTITVTIPANTWPGQIAWTARTYDASGTQGPVAPFRTVVGTPAAATGGMGGTSVDAVKLYDLVQAERALRALTLV